MKNLAIARRYARALLMIGKNDGQADLYREELSGFADLLEENSNFEDVITNPLYGEGDRKKVLVRVLDKLGLSKTMISFLVLLFDKKRFSVLSHIVESYGGFVDEVKGVARASLVSAVSLPPETIEKVRVALSERTGREVVLEVRRDSKLIGGMVTTIGDLVLDGSVRTQLSNMRESLRRGESV